MTISFVNQGTTPTGIATGTGSTSISPDNPASTADGDMVLLAVVAKPDTATIVTPTGWDPIVNGENAGGGGTTGADTGPTRCAVFAKRVNGTIATAPTVSVTSGNSCWAQMFAYRSTHGANTGWSLAAANGIDSTTGSAWSATCATNPGLEAGDWVLVASSIPTDVTTPAQFTGESISATGATFANMVERSEPEGTVNNDIGGFVFQMDVTAGPATAAPVVTATAAATNTNVRGVSVLVRMRDGASPIGSVIASQFEAINRAALW